MFPLVVALALPLPPPGPMARSRDVLGAAARVDGGAAAQRSPAGHRIVVQRYGSGTARSRVLVAGCVNGRRCAGERLRVVYECPPDDADIWFLPTLRPEGEDLDRAPGHPGAAALRQAVADLRPQVTVLHRSGARAVVRAGGAGEAAGRRYARIAGLPFAPADAGGLAGWVQAALPGSAAIIVELPAGRIPPLKAQRHVFALQRLAGTRAAFPIREARLPGGTISVLHTRFERVTRGSGPSLTMTQLVRRPDELPCDPATTRRRLGRFGTIVRVTDFHLVERGTAFPPRPRRLRLGAPGQHPCLGRAHVVRFSDGGRNVEVVVAFGREAANRWTRRNVRGLLDAITVER